MGSLQKLYETYEDKGLVVLGFNSSDNHEKGVEFLDDNGVTFPSILDPSSEANRCIMQYETLGMSAVPMSYLIDRSGKVMEAWYGYRTGYAEKKLKELGFE